MNTLYKLINSICVSVCFLFFLTLDTVKCSAEESGFAIKDDGDQSLSIVTTPFEIFTIQDKLIYPGSKGSSVFVINNNSSTNVEYELILTKDSEGYQNLPIQFTLLSDTEKWQFPIVKKGDSVHKLEIKKTIPVHTTIQYQLNWYWSEHDEQNQAISSLTLKEKIQESISIKIKGQCSKSVIPSPTENDLTDEFSESPLGDNLEKNGNSRKPSRDCEALLPQTGEKLELFIQLGVLICSISGVIFLIRREK